MLKQGSKIDIDGFFIEEVIYDDSQEINDDIVTVERLQGLYKAKWDGEKWIETATKEYIDSVSRPQPPTLTLEERISILENLQLQQGGLI